MATGTQRVGLTSGAPLAESGALLGSLLEGKRIRPTGSRMASRTTEEAQPGEASSARDEAGVDATTSWAVSVA